MKKTTTHPRLKIVRYHRGRLRLLFRFDVELIGLIKTFPMHVWEPETRTWSVPHTETILRTLKAFCQARGWTWLLNRETRWSNPF